MVVASAAPPVALQDSIEIYSGSPMRDVYYSCGVGWGDVAGCLPVGLLLCVVAVFVARLC